MSIYISYHPLDYDFAYELLIHVRNLGLSVSLFTPDLGENSGKTITKKDKLIAILRPEYLQTADYLAVVNLLETISGFFPILRVPISIDEWSANIVFRPVADFTGRDNDSIEMNLKLLWDMLIRNDDKSLATHLTSKEIYLNNLALTLRTYIRPITSLEYINYAYDLVSELPLTRFLQKSQFKIDNSNKHAKWRDGYQWNRKDFLESMVKYYKSFVVVCNDIDPSAMAYHLVDMVRHRAAVDVSAPIPIFLDVENWSIDVPWLDWLSSQLSFSHTPIEDIASGKCTVFVYGLDHVFFKTHPLKDGFEEWLCSVSPPRNLIIICTYLNNLDDYLTKDTIIIPIESNLEQLQEVCKEYADRPFAQFIAGATENKIASPALSYLLQNPVLAVTLLSVKFEPHTDFEQLEVSDYFHFLIENLWQIATCRNTEDKSDFSAVESTLLKLAALTTEQQKVNFSYSNTLPLNLMTKCVDADFLLVSKNTMRFSMPIIQEYFAAKALVQFGISTQLPCLTLDKSLRRLAQRWDKSIILSGHLSGDKDEILKHIAKLDPMLTLRCIASGVHVSSHLYTSVVEENLNALITKGDFRVDFAKILYSIDPKAAKAIFIEILRDAHWSIRLDAFAVFTELETLCLPGVAEAITEITENSRNHVVKALHRLGTDGLSTLFALLRKDNAKLRLNAAWALGELQDKASVPALVEVLHDNDLSVSKQAIVSLDLLQDISCMPYLVQYLDTNHTSIQKVISTALVHLHSAMSEPFTMIVQKMDTTAKRSVIHALHGSTSEKLVDFLLELSRDENVDVRLAAIKALGSHPETRVISRLEDCLGDMSKSRLSKSTVSEVVSKMLSSIQKTEPKITGLATQNDASDSTNAKLKSSEIVKARLLQVKETRVKEQDSNYGTTDDTQAKVSEITMLQSGINSGGADDSYVSAILEQLRERTWTSSSNAAKTLREYVKGLHGTASLSVINQILETLNDTDWMIRWTGVETLGWTGNINVVPHLVQRLTDKNWKVRIAAIRSLSEIGDKTAVAGLSVLLSDNNSVVREAAAEALGLLGGKEAIRALESAVADQEDFVRLAVVESLGKTRQKAAEKILLSALNDRSEHVRWAAANGLSGIASDEIVSSLLPSLSDTTGPYWEQKRICDVIVDILKQIGSDEAMNAVTGWVNNQV